MFRKNKNQPESEVETTVAADIGNDPEQSEPAVSEQASPQPLGHAVAPELDGPYDVSVAPDDGVIRIDFGSIKVPGVEGMNVNLEMDEQTQTISAITIVIGEAGMQLQAFAAPRSGGFWEEVQAELVEGISGAGGGAAVIDGRFGARVRASVPAMNEAGEHGLQNVQFIGAEGPRWMLRGVLLGAAAEDERAAEVFEDVFAGCVVERGNQPMAPGELLELSLPDDAVAAAEDDEDEGDARPPLDPFERGPEITEIR